MTRLLTAAAMTVAATYSQAPMADAHAQTVEAPDVWARLAHCESGTRNLRGRRYSGFFQFSRRTWRSMGETGVAADHPYSVQVEAAKRLLARSGPGQWPTCGRRVGLERAA